MKRRYRKRTSEERGQVLHATRKRGVTQDWASDSWEWWDGARHGRIDHDALEHLPDELLGPPRPRERAGDHVLSQESPLRGLPWFVFLTFYRPMPPCNCAEAHLGECPSEAFQREQRAREEAELEAARRADGVVHELKIHLDEVAVERLKDARAKLERAIAEQAAIPPLLVPVPPEPPPPGDACGHATYQPSCSYCRRERRQVARDIERAQPSAVAAAPAAGPRGVQVYCASQYDPDE